MLQRKEEEEEEEEDFYEILSLHIKSGIKNLSL
jgi:hypothetical protein